MKKVFLLFLLIPGVSFAWKGPQSDAYMLSYLRWGAKYEFGNEYQQNLYYGAKPEVLKQNKVSTVKAFNITKKGRKKDWYERTYDLSGRLVQMKTEYGTVNYKFTDTLLSEIRNTTKKYAFKTRITYDSESRITKIQSFRNEKLTAETNYVYFNGNQASLVERKIFGNLNVKYQSHFTMGQQEFYPLTLPSKKSC